MRISNITAALLLGAALLFHPLTSAAQTEAAAADTLQDQGLTQEDINMVMKVFDKPCRCIHTDGQEPGRDGEDSVLYVQLLPQFEDYGL